jgi:predicted DsbA family dithiol-disulfide isomerase
MNNDKSGHPLLCDPKQGVCETPGHAEHATGEHPSAAESKPVKVIYFTDPICSSCWGIEPQLRRMKMEYGHDVEVEYHMGGLLPKWEGFNGGGITKPSDVYYHWEEVSHHYNMPILGDVWINDPLPSSYPPSIAFKAAQIQSKEKALTFLRRIREMVFIEARNITRWEYLQQAGQFAGLDTAKLRADYEGAAIKDFEADLQLARQLGVRGFPTLFFTDNSGNRNTVYGFRPYADFERAVLSMYPDAKADKSHHDIDYYMKHYGSITAQELALFDTIAPDEASRRLDDLVKKGKLRKVATKNGDLWRKPE